LDGSELPGIKGSLRLSFGKMINCSFFIKYEYF
jgi:hypothetical protein